MGTDARSLDAMHSTGIVSIIISVESSVVGTTVKNPDDLPEDLLADEKHTRFNGQKVYIATTVANDCVLGASVSLDADTEGLTEAYGHFKTEANNVSQDYEPKTVGMDGWTATKLA